MSLLTITEKLGKSSSFQGAMRFASKMENQWSRWAGRWESQVVLTALLSFHCFHKAVCEPFFLYSEKDGQLRRQRDEDSEVEEETLRKSKLIHMYAMFDRQSSMFPRTSFIFSTSQLNQIYFPVTGHALEFAHRLHFCELVSTHYKNYKKYKT